MYFSGDFHLDQVDIATLIDYVAIVLYRALFAYALKYVFIFILLYALDLYLCTIIIIIIIKLSVNDILGSRRNSCQTPAEKKIRLSSGDFC